MLTGIPYDLLPQMPPECAQFKDGAYRLGGENTWQWRELLADNGYILVGNSRTPCPINDHSDIVWVPKQDGYHAIIHVNDRVYIDPNRKAPDIVTPSMMMGVYEFTGLHIPVKEV